jgi:hypothetical protein
MFSIVFHYQSFAKQRSSLPLAEKDFHKGWIWGGSGQPRCPLLPQDFLSISPVEKEYDGFLER